MVRMMENRESCGARNGAEYLSISRESIWLEVKERGGVNEASQMAGISVKVKEPEMPVYLKV